MLASQARGRGFKSRPVHKTNPMKMLTSLQVQYVLNVDQIALYLCKISPKKLTIVLTIYG
jgi:hypothetical protein